MFNTDVETVYYLGSNFEKFCKIQRTGVWSQTQKIEVLSATIRYLLQTKVCSSAPSARNAAPRINPNFIRMQFFVDNPIAQSRLRHSRSFRNR